MNPESNPDLERAISVYGRSGANRVPLWQRLANWQRKVILLLVLGAVGLAGAVVVRKGYGVFREAQLDRNLEEAQVAARLGDWPLARNRARSVLLARPGDFEAFRIWQRALGETGEPRSYLAAAQIFMDPRGTLDDRVRAFEVMCRQAPQAVALGAYAAREDELKTLPAARASLAEVLMLRGEYEFAEQYLRESSDLAREPRVQLALLKVLCGRPNAERVAEARTIFASLLAGNASEEGLAALEVLANTPGGLAPGGPLPYLPEWVKTRQDDAKDRHHLLALNPELQEKADDAGARQRLFDNAVSRFSATAPGDLGSWLVRHNQAELAADALKEQAATRPDAFIARLHALVRLERIDEVDRLLSEPPKATDPVELELVKVAVARIRGDAGLEYAAWNRALYQALLDDSKNRFIEIAKHAELLAVPSVAERAWVAAVRVGWGQIPLYRDFLPLFASLARKQQTHNLEAMYLSLIRYEPQNPELRNNVLYLGLLHDRIQARTAMDGLAALAEENPEMPEIFSGAAVAALVAGEGAKALEWLPLFAETRRVSPTMRQVIEGIALLLEGRKEDAEKRLENVQWQHLLNLENIVFRRLLIDLQVRDLPIPVLQESEPSGDVEDTAAWEEAMKRLERERVTDTLPALPAPRIRSDERDDLQEK